MKTVVVVLMLADFAGVAFGRGLIPDWLYFCLMPLMVGLLVWYWFVMFWFRRKRLSEVIEKDPEFEIFAGRIQKDVQADLQRGRLVVFNGSLILFQLNKKTNKVEEVWKLPIKDIKSVGFGTLLPVRRKGLRIFTETDTHEFVCEPVLKRKDEFYKAIGWKVPENQSIDTQTGR